MFIRATIIAAALLAPVAAYAGPTAKVAFHRSELASVEGRAAISHRIATSTRNACYGDVSLMEEARCRRELSVDIVKKIGNEALMAAYQVRTTAQG